MHVNFDSAMVDPVYFPQLEVVGDIANSIWQIKERIAPQPHWNFELFRRAHEAYLAHREESEADEGLEHRLKELTDHISLLLNDILAYLKGDVLRLVPAELKALTQVVMTCKDRSMCVKVFKEAHLFAKQIITEAAGQRERSSPARRHSAAEH